MSTKWGNRKIAIIRNLPRSSISNLIQFNAIKNYRFRDTRTLNTKDNVITILLNVFLALVGVN